MCPFPAVCTRVYSRMLYTTSCSVAMMIVSKRAPQRDRVSCSVTQALLDDDAHQLRGVLAKGDGLLFGAHVNDPASLVLLPLRPRSVVPNHVLQPPISDVSVVVSSPPIP